MFEFEFPERANLRSSVWQHFPPNLAPLGAALTQLDAALETQKPDDPVQVTPTSPPIFREIAPSPHRHQCCKPLLSYHPPYLHILYCSSYFIFISIYFHISHPTLTHTISFIYPILLSYLLQFSSALLPLLLGSRLPLGTRPACFTVQLRTPPIRFSIRS